MVTAVRTATNPTGPRLFDGARPESTKLPHSSISARKNKASTGFKTECNNISDSLTPAAPFPSSAQSVRARMNPSYTGAFALVCTSFAK